MKEYSYKNGARIAIAVDAQVFGETLDKLQARDGKVTPEALLKEAMPKRSPIHNVFNWDDTEAARQWRLWQARASIREVCVKVLEVPEHPPIRAYVHTEHSYQPIEVVAEHIDLYAEAVGEMKGKIKMLGRSISELEVVARSKMPDKIKSIVALQAAFERVDTLVDTLH